MIKRADQHTESYPDLVSAKPRGGMQTVSRLVELLIKQYEIQDQMRQTQKRGKQVKHAPIAGVDTSSVTQATFGWYE